MPYIIEAFFVTPKDMASYCLCVFVCSALSCAMMGVF